MKGGAARGGVARLRDPSSVLRPSVMFIHLKGEKTEL
jgi:hypothetical protein